MALALMLALAPSTARIPIRRKGGDSRTVTIPHELFEMTEPMPQSPDAERAVLGSVLINNHAWFRVGNLTTDHFFKDAHRTIFATMALMVEERLDIEPLTLKEELAKRGLLEQVGGVAYISSLLDMVPDVANVERYAAIVERMAKKREGAIASYRAAKAYLDPETEPETVAMATIAALGPLATREDRQARSFVRVLNDALEAQRRRSEGHQDDIALRSGYQGLDAVRAIKRSFTIIGAPSESGKTTHLLNLWDGLSTNGHPTALFTLESSEEEVALRYASMKAQIPHSYMQDWKLMSDGNMKRLASLRSGHKGAPMFITMRLRNVEEIYLECQRLRAVEGIDAVLIDYLQRVRAKGFRPSEREQSMAHIAETCLDMSLDLGIGVIAASQLRDDWTKRPSGRLIKEDLKYARALGETARVVLMFHRPRSVDKSNKELKWCEVVYQIEKNSENRTDDPKMHMDEVTQRFTDGDCESNNCRTLRNVSTERKLFNDGG